MPENTGKEPNHLRARQMMVDKQLRRRHISDTRVLEVIGNLPRHLFVSPEHQAAAYTDGPLPIGEDQTISQPYMVALMLQQLSLNGHERVLEIGTGSGYQTALLCCLASEVSESPGPTSSKKCSPERRRQSSPCWKRTR